MANLLQNQGAYCQRFPPGGGLMKVRTLALGLVMTGFTLASAVPALAQNPKVSDPGGGSGARSNPGSSGSGETAVSRGGGGAATTTSSGGGGAATPRGSSAAPASGGNNRSSGGGNGARSRTNPDNSNNASGAREVPTWSRPRGDQPVTGSAVTRTGPPPNHNGSYNGSYG